MHTLGAALRALAALDNDHASERNSAGFNGADSEVGNALAKLPEGGLSPRQARFAWTMLRKYRKQLAGQGIRWELIPEPPVPTDEMQAAWRARKAAGKIAPPQPRRSLVRQGDLLFIVAPFDQVHNAEIRATLPARFHKPSKRWVMDLPTTTDEVATLRAFARRHGYDVAPTVENTLDAVIRAAEAMHTASQAASSDITIAGLKRELYPFQRAGVAYATQAKRVLIGDEMGLGKTTQAIATVHYLDAYPALVVTTAATKYNWRREWLATVENQNLRVVVLNGKAADISNADVVVVNYDLLKKWLDPLLARNFASIIADESHYLKTETTQRTKLVHYLATGRMKRGRGAGEHEVIKREGIPVRILLTGTPIVNRPVELVSQIEILGHMRAFGNAWRFKNRYCGPQNNGRGTTFDGATNVAELNDKLRSLCYVRREKKAVAGELPPINRPTVVMPIDNRAEYVKAERNVIEFIRQAAQRDREFRKSIAHLPAEEQREALHHYSQQAAQRAAKAETLVRINTLKQLTAQGKLAAITEWVTDFLESGEKLILFAHHIATQQALLAAFPGALHIFGDDDAQSRDEAAQRFQHDPDAKLIICSISAAREGVTLTAASNLAFCELGWTPAAHDQAEARCYGRINDLHGATAWYLLAEDTIDETIAALIEDKRAVVAAVTSGGDIASRRKKGGSIFGDVVRVLAREGGVADTDALSVTESDGSDDDAE